jgi:hypothetical protein
MACAYVVCGLQTKREREREAFMQVCILARNNLKCVHKLYVHTCYGMLMHACVRVCAYMRVVDSPILPPVRQQHNLADKNFILLRVKGRPPLPHACHTCKSIHQCVRVQLLHYCACIWFKRTHPHTSARTHSRTRTHTRTHAHTHHLIDGQSQTAAHEPQRSHTRLLRTRRNAAT